MEGIGRQDRVQRLGGHVQGIGFITSELNKGAVAGADQQEDDEKTDQVHRG